ESNGKSFRVYYAAEPAPIPRGQPFVVDVWVVSREAIERPLDGARLELDAAMPEHEHGMNRVPVVKPLENGHFRVEGVLFHMAGRWELYFDVTRADITERAQIEVALE